MDEHIANGVRDSDYKPSDGFVDFCRNSVDLLKEEVTRLLINHNINDVNFINEKFKKTYKNRYFMLLDSRTVG
jgi:hypothetical protein